MNPENILLWFVTKANAAFYLICMQHKKKQKENKNSPQIIIF